MPHMLSTVDAALIAAICALQRPIVLVGLMGVGKSQIGAALAHKLALPFVDADQEIERTAGLAVAEIFDRFGEPKFRELEARVIYDLLCNGQPLVLATGGGAFMQDGVRQVIRDHSIAVWLRAELSTLLLRTARSKHRPLLQTDNPAAVMESLMEKRYPIYAEAHIIVDTDFLDRWRTLDAVLKALYAYGTSPAL